MITTVITKPTRVCNAACTYCSAPPDGVPKWSLDDFKFYFARLAPHLTERAVIIWHGGEPMLMGPEFYQRAYDYARSIKPEIRFAIQSNLLSYDTKRWSSVFSDIFGGAISTSYDPDEKFRVYKGSTALYSRLFFEKLSAVTADGFMPMVIGTYSEETADLGTGMYDRVMAAGPGRQFDIRYNYRYPAGRDSGRGEMISPQRYGQMLLDLYNKWIVDVPDFMITPLDQMLKKTIELEAGRCPWTSSCGGKFLGLEPNGDLYNCSEFADLGDDEYRFGNLREQTIPEVMQSRAARLVRRRRVDLPLDCQSCRHFQECEGGCVRDAVLYNHGMGGKFHYCQSWMMVFDRIKETIRNGEADGIIAKMGKDPDQARKRYGWGHAA